MDRNGLSAFLLGLGVGVGLGMLFAPKSGEETRTLIKNKAGEGTDFLKQQSTVLKDSASQWVDKGRDALSRQKETLADAVEAGKQAYRDTVGGREPSATETMYEARFNGGGSTYSAIDPKTSDEAIDLGMTSGSVENLGTDGVVVSKATADSEGWKVGDTVSSEFAETGKHDLEVVGIYDNKGWISDNYVISLDAQREFAGQQLSASGLVLLASGADQAEVKDAIDAVLVDHPDAQILDQGEYEEVASGFIDQLLTFVTVMLLFAVVIALLGIVNTLVLSVFERTRELGLLRAVGMTRTQVRSMVRWESVVISLIGAVTGAVLGIGIGLALAQALKDEGIKAINVPWLQVIIYVALAAIAGVVAAIGPARAASKVDVLKAVVTE